MNWYIKVLKQYADFKGRARRKEYWMFSLFNIIVYIALFFVGIFDSDSEGITIYSLATIVPRIALSVRRMHDVGKSGWFIFIPIYNLILYCTEGVNHDNEYGADPKANNA